MAVKIEIDPASGFCNGVVSAIRKAEAELEKGGTLYCLGDIVHNSDEVERLRQKGLVTITHEQLKELRNVRVLLRAHGEPPSTYELAARNGIEIIDATCPVVLMLQRRIKQTYDTHTRPCNIVIYGKTGHAEVNGLVGQTSGEAIVVEEASDLSRIDFNADVELYSQTTKSIQGLREISAEISRRLTPGVHLETHDTICRQVSNRVGGIREFAAAHDVVLFVSGAKSSNGKILYNECLAVNPHTHLVSNATQLKPEMIAGAASIGICGATSTPRWLMEQVRDAVSQCISHPDTPRNNG